MLYHCLLIFVYSCFYLFLQKARLARIRLAKNASGNAFVSRKKEADRMQQVSLVSSEFILHEHSVITFKCLLFSAEYCSREDHMYLEREFLLQIQCEMILT